MIICNIADAGRYAAISPLVAEAIEWLKAYDPATFTPGRTDLSSGIFVKAEEPALKPRELARLEAHKNYIDIQVPLKNTESMGWAPVESLKHVITPYDADKDVAFYGDDSACMLHVRPGQMAIFFPEDAHAPNIGIGRHRKLCVKIPVIKK